MFIHKLCVDNNAFVEFHLFVFFVMDQLTKRVLLQGQSHMVFKGSTISMYFPTLILYIACVFFTDVFLWHSRLRHPAYPIVYKVLNETNIKSFNIIKLSAHLMLCLSHINYLFVSRHVHSISPFQYLYIDLWVSLIKSCTGTCYAFFVIDDSTCFM